MHSAPPPRLLLRSTGFSVQKISVEQTFVPYRNFVAQEIGPYLPNSELGSASSCDTWVRVMQPAGRLTREKVREREREVNEQQRKLSEMSGVGRGKTVSWWEPLESSKILEFKSKTRIHFAQASLVRSPLAHFIWFLCLHRFGQNKKRRISNFLASHKQSAKAAYTN